LETDEERAALERLDPSWGNRKDRVMFQRAVLAQLALIDAVHENAGTQPPKNAKIAENFGRRAKKVRNFVDRMTRPMSENLATSVVRRIQSWPPPFGWSPFPKQELLAYADACDHAAALFRHTADPQSARIVALLNFVRLHTGKPHLSNLATLLKRPCTDIGMNAKRLNQLLRDYGTRHTETRRQAEQARAGIGAFIAEQLLGKPPAL
jgi:hypothetical protein